LALDELNGKGGINGRPFQYDFQDTQSDPKQSVVVAQKFVADSRIVAELADFSSTASMAASPIYQCAGLVQFGFSNSCRQQKADQAKCPIRFLKPAASRPYSATACGPAPLPLWGCSRTIPLRATDTSGSAPSASCRLKV
jgi:hypothetical protein